MNAREARRGATAPRRPVAMVTGANSGIGASTVAALLERGAAVVATVRSADAAAQLLDHLDGDSVDLDSLTIEHLDVSDADRAHIVIDRHRPDVLVNNAGHALLGAVRDVSIDEAREQLDELLLGPTHLALLASTHQIAHGEGRIVNVTSVLAEAQIPFTGWYSAAKAGLESVTDALRIELAPAGIHVVTVQCGAVGTDAWEVAGDQVQEGSDPLTAEARSRWADLTGLARPLFGDPADVGSVIADAALDPNPRPIYRVGFGSHLGVLMRSTPTWISDAVTRRALGLRGKEDEVDGSENQITIEADVRRVFDVLVDPTTYPDWLVGAQAIRAVDPSWPAVGSRFHHRLGVGPAAVPGSTSVLECSQDTVLELGAGMGIFGEARVRFTLAGGPGRTVVTVEEEPREGPIRLAWTVLHPLVRVGLWGRNQVSLSSLRRLVLEGSELESG